jgi:hypothetical protein
VRTVEGVHISQQGISSAISIALSFCCYSIPSTDPLIELLETVRTNRRKKPMLNHYKNGNLHLPISAFVALPRARQALGISSKIWQSGEGSE